MKRAIFLAIAVLACGGCTTLALKNHALKQEETPTEIRYREVLDNLALVANNPASLPAYSSIFAGTAQITDTAQLAANTTIVPGASTQVATPQLTRIALGNWTLDPLNSPEKLETIRGACQWVIYGPQFAFDHDPARLLASPLEAPIPGRHFGVAEPLAQLPVGWVHVGPKAPHSARYKSHCGQTSVWVMPEDIKSLADFTLIIQNIARIDINSPTLWFIKQQPSDFQFPTPGPEQDPCCTGPLGNAQRRILAQVSVDACGNLTSDTNYYRWRTENVGSDPALRSQINAAGLH